MYSCRRVRGRVDCNAPWRRRLQVMQEIFDMEKNIELLKKCVQDKEAPMQVAQTRLATRVKRPNVEACRDPVQHR